MVSVGLLNQLKKGGRYMKYKFNDFGRCLICLHNPCDCKKTSKYNSKKIKWEGNIGGDPNNPFPLKRE